MTDVLRTVSTAWTLATRLREVSKNIEDAEFKNALADLLSQLAESKIDAAQAKEERAALMNRVLELEVQIRDLESVDGEPCPKCGKRAWVIKDSRPHPSMGDLGVAQRTMHCTECDFTEATVVTPNL